MGLINLVLKSFILVLDLRDTYDALDAVKLKEIGCNQRQVLVRNAQDGTKHITTQRRVGTSKRKAAVKSALTTVLVWNLFHKVEPVCDRTIAWFVPFYDSFKTLFLVWMLSTRSYGAAILLHRFLAPMIRPYESIIEGTFDVTLALIGWLAALLAPVLDKFAPLWQVASSFARIASHSASAHAETIAESTSPPSRSQPTSKVSTAEKAMKKPRPPPDASSGSIKAPPASVPFMARAVAEPQPRLVPTKSRQALAKKASQSNLAATRRVLQELPVPRHAFEPVASSSTNAPKSTSTTQSTAAPPATAPIVPVSRNGTPVIKAEPSDPTLGPRSIAPSGPAVSVPLTPTTAASLGPPPTPPTGLRNYAFIPGMTPQRAGRSSVISPTPRFPGGFSFSFAAPQASTSSNTNPFQSQARVPATTQMAPLSLSSQKQALAGPSSTLGGNNIDANSMTTYESVPAAQYDRIVPPPNGTARMRKASSSRSLKSATASDAKRAASKTLTASTSKKRSRPDEATEGSVSVEGQPAAATTSPRKRPKAAPSKTSSSKTTASASAKIRPTAKVGSVNAQAATSAAKRAATRKKATANGGQRTAKKSAPSQATAETTEESMSLSNSGDKEKRKAASSPRKKATSTFGETGAASRKPSAQRTATKKSSSASASRSTSVEASEASEPPQRLTRSRTKQNLAG